MNDIKDVKEVKEAPETIKAPETAEAKTEETVETAAAGTVETAAPATPNPTANPVKVKLTEYGADDTIINNIINDLGVESAEDLAVLEVDDLVKAGMKLAKARLLVKDLKAKSSAQAVNAAESRVIQAQFESLLPTVPSDESWLLALKSGGISKVEDSSYIAAIRAALADRAGLYDIPAKLTAAMEAYADETEEQVDPVFFSLRKSLIRRTYGDIFSAIDGLDGTFITEGRRKKFLKRIGETLWPAITRSFYALDKWYQTWTANVSNPSMLLAAIGGLNLGGSAAGMGIMTPPDVAPLHDAGDDLIDAINRVFSGVGVQVVAALAYDSNTIRNTLEDTRLPSLIGVPNREMMLKKIGANVSSNYVRLEQNLVKYVLGFVKHNTITSDVEANYFAALWQLGMQINWNDLDGSSGSKGLKGLTGEDVL